MDKEQKIILEKIEKGLPVLLARIYRFRKLRNQGIDLKKTGVPVGVIELGILVLEKTERLQAEGVEFFASIKAVMLDETTLDFLEAVSDVES